MKRKIKYLAAAVLGLFWATMSDAQKAYVSVNAGYNVGVSKHNLDYFDFYNYVSSFNSYSEEQVYVSLGKGFNFGTSFGYKFSKHLGAELGVSGLLGGTTEARSSSLGSREAYAMHAQMLRLNPSIVISTGAEVVDVYAKFGVVFGFASVYFDIESNSGATVEKQTIEMNGGMGFGFSSGLGALYKLKQNFSVFSELNLMNLSYAPTKGEVTSYTVNGFNTMATLTTDEKKFEFVDSYSVNQLFPPPNTQPTKLLRQSLPFSSLGLNVGVLWAF